MGKQAILISVVALLIVGISGYFIGFNSGWHSKEVWGPVPTGGHMSDVKPVNNPNMGMGHADHMMDMMVQSERDFITKMIPHHEEAVNTAKEVLARGGTTPEIKQLVSNIVSAQEKEIAEMKKWYEDWYGVAYTNDGQYMEMMRDLAELSGPELDRAFLEDMIVHHMGAIMMARSVQPYIEHEEINKLGVAIIDTQSAEIKEMQKMLEGL